MDKKFPGIVPYEKSEIVPTVDHFATGLNRFLQSAGLPSEDVLVIQRERMRVLQNLPAIVDELPAGRRKNAYYLSKYVAACGAGLFDAALNYVWNEIVSSFRTRVANFDLDYFLETVISEPKRRDNISLEADLAEMEDWELIKGCHTTDLITDIAFYNLDLIRNMRNHASAAHPNQNDMSGLKLASFLEDCIRYVLSSEPSGPIITVKSLLRSVRTEIFKKADLQPIVVSISTLPEPLANSFLRHL